MILLLSVQLFLTALSAARCDEHIVAHPPPLYDVSNPVLRDAFAHIGTLLNITLGDPEYDSTSISVEITSSKETLWSYHHTARERNDSRPDAPQVNGDALYRIASITKTFTVLGILKQHEAGNLSLDDPVDKYVGELQGKQNGSIPWNDITLRSLASQLSGIPREFGQSDLINPQSLSPFTPEEIGLPPVSREGLLKCDEYSDNFGTPCTGDDLIRMIKTFEPLFAPNQQSSYSNVAFELLGLVLENVTSQTFESYINEAIFKPLDMSKSTLSLPPDSAGVIPVKPHYWDVDEGVQNPTGGIYSSSTDLSKYLRYILTHFNSITTSLNWMNVVSPAQNLNSFYGMPWEIFHTDRILSKSQRTVRFITKGGGLPGYTSLIILAPEYDLGITLLLAGPSKYFSTLLEIVTRETIRTAEEVSILQLQQLYAGRFISPDPTLNSSITLIADHRGLMIEKFISNGTDVMGPKLAKFVGDGSLLIKVVPTLLYKDEESNRGEKWRFLLTTEPTEEERPIWDDSCVTNMELMLYAGRPWNEIILWQSENGGMFNDIELPAYRVNLTRIIARPTSYDEAEEQLEL
ncbi:beta-lactamase/transpeptidase-like protein [Massarina eburnea CBS 473.64]|uniref:Beta-lactamase/transpeptidase-like protein n=1 Tax=Massarina eburnea CBS 473.64 TaxID=1395130 RepID=A0A6A6S071_9PLEO|nr:beta-lactamase/transpeptidase-like protein [Massarina eburnea CBS 473.64]